MTRSTLAGRIIVITRPGAQAGNLARLLTRSKARVICAPLIKIAPPASYRGLDRALERLESYDWVVFTSRNAVDAFFARIKKKRFRALKRPSGAVGAKTAAALRLRGWKPSIVPGIETGAALARALPLRRGQRVLIPRARKAGADLPAILRRRGARVEVVEAYRTVADEKGAARLRALAAKGGVDAVTFTSGSTAEHLRRALGAARFRKLFARATDASIGPVTTAALRRCGARPVQARSASDEALAAALEAHFA